MHRLESKRRAILCAGVVTVSLLALSPAHASEKAAKSLPHRPKVCLVLGGGGARGAAHVGVLRVLQHLHVPVDCIVGTSMGAIVGGLYASGMPVSQLEADLRNPLIQAAMADKVQRRNVEYRQKQDDSRYTITAEFGIGDGKLVVPQGFVTSHNARRILSALTLRTKPASDFDKLPIPFRAVATDIGTGESVVLDHGDLAEAIRASMSVPGLYSPVHYQGHYLVDGGLTDNVPIDVARKMGADIVIAVNVATPLVKREQLRSVVDISVQVLNLLTGQNVDASLKHLQPQDVFIKPDLHGIAAADFNKMGEAIERGEQAAEAVAGKLKALAVAPDVYAAWQQRQSRMNMAEPRIAFVDIRGNTRVSRERVLSRLGLRAGDKLDFNTVQAGLERIYQLGEFERAEVAFAQRDGKTGLLIQLTEKPWHPNYVRFGLNIADDLEGEGTYNLRVGFLRPDVNSLGGEWKNELQIGRVRRVYSEFYQPMPFSQKYFIAPQVEYHNDLFDLFTGERRYAQYSARTIRTTLDFGRTIGVSGEVRLGLERGRNDSEVRIGDPALPRYQADYGGIHARMAYDGLDNPNFPAHGFFVNFDGLAARHMFGGNVIYDKAEVTAGMAGTAGDNTFVISGAAGTSFATALPLYRQFALGGFLSLPGLRQNQLRGDRYLALHGIYYNRIANLPTVLGRGVYIGGTLDAGNTWGVGTRLKLGDLRYGGSLFVGADTALGPFYVAIGASQGGQEAIYLFLGRPF